MASKAIIASKVNEVEELKKKFEEANSTIVVDYLGLSVTDITELRKELHAEGVDFKVYKNNIIRRAANLAGIDYLDEFLVGSSAVSFSDKIVEPAKIIQKYADNFDKFEVKAGVVENGFADKQMISELASIPSMEGLLTMLAGGMISPLKDIAVGLHMLVEGESEFEFK